VRRAGLLSLAVFVALAMAALALPDAGASGRRSCGTIESTSVYPYARVVVIRNVSCRKARRVAKRYDSRGTPPPNWACALAHDDRPRLFSCGSGGRRGDLRRWPRALEAIGTRRR
jgi:hypothetical protein